jgi:uncharacterized membrane protein (DUF441 family)
MDAGRTLVKSKAVSWRKWAFYGALIAAAYTAQDTYVDLETKPLALYIGKLIGSIIAGAILGGVAGKVRNRYARGDNIAANPDKSA